MKNKKIKLRDLLKLAQQPVEKTAGILIDKSAFLEALSGREKEPPVKVESISVKS